MAAPTGSPYFDSSSQVIDESKKNLLNAVATGGTAGKQAFDAAQAAAAQAKQDAVARAAQRAALYGVGGNDQTFLGAYDTRANQMGVNRANFESGLAQTQASGESYLEKARGAIPVLQAVNANKAQDTESKIKLAIQAAQAKAQAEAEKQARAEQAQIDRENRADARANARADRSDARAAARDAAKTPKLPTADQLLGQGKTLADQINTGLHAGANAKPGDADAMGDVDNAVFLGNQSGLYDPTQGADTVGMARQYAKSLGMDEGTINGILTPAKTGAWDKAAAPTRDAYAKALATKYASKGVDDRLASSVVNNVDWQGDVTNILNGAGGLSREAVDAALRKHYVTERGWNAEYEILRGEYLPMLPTQKELDAQAAG